MEKAIPLKVAAPAGAVVAGIILALFEVQGWNMPTPLAILLLVILFGLLALFISVVCLSGIKAIKQFAEHRAISATWVSTAAPGLLDCKVDGKRALDRLMKEFERLEVDTNKLSQRITTHSKQIEKLQNYTQKSIKDKDRLKTANRIGAKINQSAIYLERRTELFKTLCNEIVRNYETLLSSLNVTDSHFLMLAFDSFKSAGVAAMSGMALYKKAAKLLEQSNLTRTIRVAGTRLEKCVDNMQDCFSRFQSDCQRLHTKLALKSVSGGSSTPDSGGSQTE